MSNKNWYQKNTGSTYENSQNREAPNKHLKGSKKYKEMIARENKKAEKFPFQFIKPPKRSQFRREIFAVCTDCYEVKLVNQYTVGSTCSSCNTYFSIEEGNRFSKEEDLEAFFVALQKKSQDDK